MTARLQLTSEQQNELLSDLTLRLVEALPEQGWKQFVLEYRQVGKHIQISVGLVKPDGSIQRWDPPEQTWRYIQTLRHGMYVEDRGTWFSIQFTIDHPNTFRIHYNYELEPKWGNPSADDFRLDLERYPHTEGSMPPWFREKLS
ncbi:hypothetical protein [Saccharopolyspora sp. NPDC002686]|uniref:hypothetical protein n=1 Tax=Saccharopolyspora sp. NPDC002686 TaxID=3154541 RepID=UPI00331C3CFE